MPRLSQWAIKAAMIYLLVGAVEAALYWLNQAWAIWPVLNALGPTYIHLIVVGCLTQLIFGVIYWMFPILSKAQPRGNPRLAWLALACLNAGLVLRAVFEPWRVIDPNSLNSNALIASAALQVVAAFCFVGVSWGRVRERGGT